MPYLFNLLYLVLLLVLLPWLIVRMLRQSRYRRGLRAKFLGLVSQPNLVPKVKTGPTVWFHGVSVGEVHLLRQVVALARQRNPHWHVVISTSTDTGYDEAQKHFADLPVIFWPLDFSWAVKTALRRVKPDLVVLAEGEMWPNFLRIAARQGVKLAVVNGRMSPRSYQRFRKVRCVARGLLSRVDLILAQNKEYAAHYKALGARGVEVTGSVKYDGAQSERDNPKTLALRELFGIADEELVWVAGSTQAPEEELVHGVYREARQRFPHLRLILVPRQKDRFESVAQLLEKSGEAFVRRSALGAAPSMPQPEGCGYHRAAGNGAPVILVDTIGELGAVWGLADVAFVGGSLDGQRGGQNMIEPAAYGAAVTFGPHTWNFKETVARLLEVGGAMQVADGSELHKTTLELLADAAKRHMLGEKARAFVLSQQGATEKSIQALELLVPQRYKLTAAAA